MSQVRFDLLQAALAEMDWHAPPVLLIQGLRGEGDLRRVRRAIAGRYGDDGQLLVPGTVKLLEPFAGLQELVEALHARAVSAGRGDLARPHWIAIRMMAPTLAGQVLARRPEACQEYLSGDTRRRAAPAWIERCLHSVADFLFAVQAAGAGGPLAVGFPQWDSANRRVREFFALLARRARGRPVLLWAAAAGRFPDELRQQLEQQGQQVLTLNLTPEAALAPPQQPLALHRLPGADGHSVAALVAATDACCYSGLWDEVLEYGRLAFERLTAADRHLLPVLAEAYRVALSDPKLTEQHIRQQLPHAATRKQRVNLLNCLALLFGQWTVDAEAGEYYARQALAVADSADSAPARAELRLIATHGLIMVWSSMGRLQAANSAGDEALRSIEALCPWEVERARRSMVLFLMAQNCERLGQLAAAIDLYRASLRYDEDYPEYYHYLCGALVRAGRCDEALTVAAEALERNPPYWRIHMWRGQALVALGQSGAAEAEFARALDLQPGAAQVYLRRALHYHEQAQLPRAIADYSSYLLLIPDDPEALANRGSARHDAGDPAGALADLDAALRHDPNLVGALANRAAVLADLGRAPAALADLERALTIDPENPILQENRAAVQALIAQMRPASGGRAGKVSGSPGGPRSSGRQRR